MKDWKKEELQLQISTLLSNDMTEQDDMNYGSEITGTSIFKNEEQVDVVDDYESKVYLHTKTEMEAQSVRTKRHKEKNSIWNCPSCDINFRYMDELKEHALETHQSN